MLHRYISRFLEYCRLVDFSIRSIQALTAKLNEFAIFLKLNRIRSVKRVSYRHLIEFAADYNSPSIHITKSRVWTLRQFYHFLTLHRIVPENIATGLPYPKIEKTVPQFLTTYEYNRLIRFFLPSFGLFHGIEKSCFHNATRYTGAENFNIDIIRYSGHRHQMWFNMDQRKRTTKPDHGSAPLLMQNHQQLLKTASI